MSVVELPDPREVILTQRLRAYQDQLKGMGAELRKLGVSSPRDLADQGQIAAADPYPKALSWTFTYQPMHLTTTAAAAEWFLKHVVDWWGRPLRVLAPGSGPATEALALHMACGAGDLDFVGLDHNPHMLRLGDRLLERLGALHPTGGIRARLRLSPNHPSVIGHLREGARGDRPLLVLASHVLNQRALSPEAIGSWARCISEGLGTSTGWLLAHEPISCRLADGRLPALRGALESEGVILDGEPLETEVIRAWTDFEPLVDQLRFQAGETTVRPGKPWFGWRSEPAAVWLLAAELRRA